MLLLNSNNAACGCGCGAVKDVTRSRNTANIWQKIRISNFLSLQPELNMVVVHMTIYIALFP